MVEVTTSGDLLLVRVRGADVLWAFKRELRLPLSSIRDLSVRPWSGFRSLRLGLRLPGTAVPGWIVAGSYWLPRGRWTFCCLHRGQRALVIELAPKSGKYHQVIVGLDDPEAVRDAIEAARVGTA